MKALLRHPLVLPLYLPAFLLSLAQGLITPVLPLFANSFEAPYLLVGLLLAGDGLGMLAGDIPAGMIVRRMDRRRGMLVGLALVVMATLALYFSRSIGEALLYRVISGMGTSLYNVSRHAYIADTITVATRGRSVALLGGTFRAGRMIGPVVSGSIAIESGLRVPFLFYAGVCALAALVIFLFNRGTVDPELPKRTAEPLTPAGVLRVFHYQARRISWPGVGNYLMQMVRAGPPVVIPLYASQVLGLDVQQIGVVMSIALAVDATLFYPTGMIMDRLGRKWAIVPSALTMAVGLALIPLTDSMAGLTLAAAINGFGNGLGSGVMLTLGADLAPPEARGEFLGAWNLIGDAGVTSGPVLVGGVADLLSLQPAILAIACTGLAAGTVFGLLVPETLKKA